MEAGTPWSHQTDPSTSLEDWTNDLTKENPQQKKILKRNRCLTLCVKLKIINDIENGVKRSVIQKQYKLPSSTLSTILSNKEDIRKQGENSDYASYRKKCTTPKYSELEDRLWEWYKIEANIHGGKSLTNSVIGKKAIELANELSLSEFTPNTGWIWRFRKRRGISRSPAAKLAKVKPEAPVNPEILEHYTSTILPGIIRQYDPNDIFIAHETGLFFRCTPEYIMPLVGERCKGGRLPKERFTVMLVCNMTGTEKLPLLVVGRFARPKSLKNMKTLPTEYISTKKVWLLPIIFEEWLSKFDKMMENSWRRVALFVAPCASHTHVENLNSISLVFLPPDINLQPANQGIIQTLKMNYRHIVIQKYLDKIEQIGPYSRLPVSVMDGLLWLREAWQAVTPECITEGFRKAGIGLPGEQVPEQNIDIDDFHNSFEKLSSLIAMDPRINAESYLSIDSHLLTVGPISSCEMMLARKELAQRYVGDEEEEDEDEEPETVLSISDARHSLVRLHKFFEHVKGTQESFSLITEMQQFVHKLTCSPQKQTTLLDFFTRCPNKKSRVPRQTLGYFFPRS